MAGQREEEAMSDNRPGTGVTNYMGSIRGIAETLDSLGMDAQAILLEAGIKPSDLAATDTRVPLSAMSEVISRAASSELGPLFGLKFAEHVHATTYHAFGLMLLSSTTLRAFCNRLQRYYAWVSMGKSVLFEEDEDSARLIYQHSPEQNPSERDWLVQASGWAATWIRMLRMSLRPDFSPASVTFTSPEPAGFREEYEHYFGCPVTFGQDEDAIVFDSAALDEPLPGGNAELARRSEFLVFSEVRALGVFDPVNGVRLALFELLPRGRSAIADVAEELGLPETELAAALKRSGVNFPQVLTDTRKELADEYIRRADLSVNEIAYMLGFSDCSNFARSFRRWTGQSPSAFRESLHLA